ncbi:MAG: hypothetical protein ACSNEK_02160 [Parachlamydiaceae bacterium]
MDLSQLTSFDRKWSKNFFCKMDRLLQKNEGARLLPFGLLYTCIGIADLVNLLGQAYFKGFINLSGAACFKQCQFKRGLIQIGVQAPCASFLLIIGVFICVPIAFTSQAQFTLRGRKFTTYMINQQAR